VSKTASAHFWLLFVRQQKVTPARRGQHKKINRVDYFSSVFVGTRYSLAQCF
jgi:hypothetical protein